MYIFSLKSVSEAGNLQLVPPQIVCHFLPVESITLLLPAQERGENICESTIRGTKSTIYYLN